MPTTCPDATFYHDVNGKRYPSTRIIPTPSSMTEYKRAVRQAYGSLRGVAFGVVECIDCHARHCDGC